MANCRPVYSIQRASIPFLTTSYQGQTGVRKSGRQKYFTHGTELRELIVIEFIRQFLLPLFQALHLGLMTPNLALDRLQFRLQFQP